MARDLIDNADVSQLLYKAFSFPFVALRPVFVVLKLCSTICGESVLWHRRKRSALLVSDVTTLFDLTLRTVSVVKSLVV